MPSHYVFRALGLPSDATPSDFQELRRFLKDGEELELLDESIVPSCPSDDTLTGLFTIRTPLPSFLQTSGSTPVFAFSLRGNDIEIDQNFLGFTQLYPTEPEKSIVADIIAVPGLGGHAYGSWKGKGDHQRMWLRNFFPRHFPRCRTMIYGYNAKMRGNSVHTISDYSRTFLRALQEVRSSNMESKRPLIFIGHGYGGILLKHTLVMANFETTGGDTRSDSLLKATYGILLFGTPHRGVLGQDLLDVVEKSGHVQARQKELLEEIQRNSNSLRAERNLFTDICAVFKIYSFNEMGQTRDELFAGSGDSWRSESATAVEDLSAPHQLPKSIEELIPVDANHSNLVKFETANNSTYRQVSKIIRQMLLEAPVAVHNRFFAKAPVHFSVPFARNEGYIGRLDIPPPMSLPSKFIEYCNSDELPEDSNLLEDDDQSVASDGESSLFSLESTSTAATNPDENTLHHQVDVLFASAFLKSPEVSRLIRLAKFKFRMRSIVPRLSKAIVQLQRELRSGAIQQLDWDPRLYGEVQKALQGRAKQIAIQMVEKCDDDATANPTRFESVEEYLGKHLHGPSEFSGDAKSHGDGNIGLADEGSEDEGLEDEGSEDEGSEDEGSEVGEYGALEPEDLGRSSVQIVLACLSNKSVLEYLLAAVRDALLKKKNSRSPESLSHRYSDSRGSTSEMADSIHFDRPSPLLNTITGTSPPTESGSEALPQLAETQQPVELDLSMRAGLLNYQRNHVSWQFDKARDEDQTEPLGLVTPSISHTKAIQAAIHPLVTQAPQYSEISEHEQVSGPNIQSPYSSSPVTVNDLENSSSSQTMAQVKEDWNFEEEGDGLQTGVPKGSRAMVGQLIERGHNVSDPDSNYGTPPQAMAFPYLRDCAQLAHPHKSSTEIRTGAEATSIQDKNLDSPEVIITDHSSVYHDDRSQTNIPDSVFILGFGTVSFVPSHMVDPPTYVDDLKMLIERTLNAPVNWWPLSDVWEYCARTDVRVRWNCLNCSRRIYVDLPEHKAYDFLGHYKSLQNFAPSTTNQALQRADHVQDSLLNSLSGQSGSSPILPTHASVAPRSNAVAYASSLSQNSVTERGNSQAGQAQGGVLQPDSTSTPLYIHWCVEGAGSTGEGRYTPIKVQDRIVTQLQEEYWRLRGKWKWIFTFRSCNKITFYKFVRQQKHRDIISVLNAGVPHPNQPPIKYDEDDPSTQYNYDLFHSEERHLDIIAKDLSHRFTCCGDGDACERQAVLNYIPKKKKIPLPEEYGAEGYGIYAELGWDAKRYLLLLLLFHIPSVAFFIFWLVYIDRKDLQNASVPIFICMGLWTVLFLAGEYSASQRRKKTS